MTKGAGRNGGRSPYLVMMASMASMAVVAAASVARPAVEEGYKTHRFA